MNQSDGNHKTPMTPEQVMINLLTTISTISAQLEANAKLHAEMLGKLDDLIGHFEVIGTAMEILESMKDKPKLDIKDVSRAFREAADEIFGEGEEEDEQDQGDPLVGSRR